MDWKAALPMRYNPIPKTDEDLADYRGSIVHLTPATTYEIELTLAGTGISTNLMATTWSEQFPLGEVVRVGNRDTPLEIKESGTPKAWRVYDGRGATIDVRHQHDACITINASNVMLRGFTLRGAGATNLVPRRTIGAIRIDGGQNIVIEDCDITDWGRLNPETGFGFDYDAAIYSRSATMKRLVVQRCRLHHPTFDGSTWYEPKYPTHTQGPQCITLFNTAGNHVIRYNECFSDLEHMYNDGIGGGSNGSFQGSPGPDSDIYGNLISHCWDDGLEVEGGSRNVRIWDNYITQCMMMIGNAPASIGPLYIWRNVVSHSQSQPNAGGGNFLKMGYANSEDWMTGHQYVFHNTLFGSDEWLPTGALGGSRIVKHTTSRNNILHVRAPRDWSASDNQRNAGNDFDYDLFNGRVPASQEGHGVRGVPVYISGAGFDPSTKVGRFQLAPDSPGASAGQLIPNFSEGYTGDAPDIGAHQRGAPPIQYGTNAGLKKGPLESAEMAANLLGDLPPHPRLLLNLTNLPGIKERAAGAFNAYYQNLRNQADEWLDREVKLPDRGGQWFHWYSCPQHGARLRTESPTRHVCPIDQEVLTGYPYDDVVLSSEHNRLAGAIRTLGLVYQVGGDTRHARKAKEILLAYAEAYQSYPLHDIRGQAKVGGGKVGPQTLDESTWLITVVEGADCIWDTLTPGEQEKVKEGLLIPATDVIRQHKMGIHNIQCWKNSAVGLTGLLLGDMRLVEEALHGPAGYYQQMAKGVSADGPWFEGAWGYHFYTLSAVLHLTEGAYHSGINLYAPELRRMFDAPLAMAMPDLSLPAFNDSQSVDLSGQAGHYQTALARSQDPRYRVITSGSRRGSESAWLHGYAEHGPVPAFATVSRNFTVSGNAILAAGAGSTATWLCMKYGPHGGGHGHPDKLNFVLYGLGQVIAPDPGTANYGVPIQSGWYRTTLAHNTLSVDEKSQQPAEGRCHAFITTNGFSAVMAEAGQIHDGVKFYRTISLIGSELIVVLDQIQSESAHLYDLAYHNRGQLALAEGTPFQPADKPGYSYLRDMRAANSSGPVHLRFDLDDRKRIWWALAGGEPTTILTGTGVGKHTEDRVPLVIARREAMTTAYLWCLNLGSEGGQMDIQSVEVTLPDGSLANPGRVAAVRIKTGSEFRFILANPDSESVTVRNQKVEGKIALLTQGDDGFLRRALTTP